MRTDLSSKKTKGAVVKIPHEIKILFWFLFYNPCLLFIVFITVILFSMVKIYRNL